MGKGRVREETTYSDVNATAVSYERWIYFTRASAPLNGHLLKTLLLVILITLLFWMVSRWLVSPSTMYHSLGGQNFNSALLEREVVSSKTLQTGEG